MEKLIFIQHWNKTKTKQYARDVFSGRETYVLKTHLPITLCLDPGMKSRRAKLNCCMSVRLCAFGVSFIPQDCKTRILNTSFFACFSSSVSKIHSHGLKDS